MTDPRDTMRWVWRGSALAALVIGWVFIAWQNHFHITAPVVFIGLGYLAVIATVYNLWRTGAAAVEDEDEGVDSTWAKPAGTLGELEREKRTLLKAIKEAEFDHEMGKLSKRDADEMILPFRARAIEVMKDIDRLTKGAAGSPREQILREVRARLELENRSPRKADKAASEGKRQGKPAKDAATAREAAVAEGSAVTASPVADDAVDPDAALADEAGAGAPAADQTGVAKTAAASSAVSSADDDVLDADSTTALEPPREVPGKVATP